MEQLLETALDVGISERSFWGMSLAEVNRRIKSWVRVHDRELKERASFNWQLANLIGISVGRCLSSDVKLPRLEEAYRGIFEEEKEQVESEELKPDINTLRFMQFASKHNLNYQEGGGEDNNGRTESNNNSTDSRLSETDDECPQSN